MLLFFIQEKSIIFAAGAASSDNKLLAALIFYIIINHLKMEEFTSTKEIAELCNEIISKAELREEQMKEEVAELKKRSKN